MLLSRAQVNATTHENPSIFERKRAVRQRILRYFVYFPCLISLYGYPFRGKFDICNEKAL